MRFLHAAGFAVLAIDFQAHGMSGGEIITIGALESFDVRASVDWLRSRLPSEKIGAIAISLGGAAALVGEAPLDVEALALESVYPDIERATSNRFRMYLGPLGAPASRFALSAGGRALGVDPEFLRPVDAVRDFRGAVFVLSGDRDKPTPIAEAIELFDGANEPKRFWAVGGAGHVDLHAYAGQEYERRMLEFLSPVLASDEY
jgi:pimeloyl-ACP methyl ester carboxylesterase